MHVAVTMDDDSLQIYCNGLKVIDQNVNRPATFSGSFVLSALASDGNVLFVYFTPNYKYSNIKVQFVFGVFCICSMQRNRK